MLRNFLKLAILLFFLFLLFTLASMEILASVIVGKYASFTFVVSDRLYFTKREDATLW